MPTSETSNLIDRCRASVLAANSTCEQATMLVARAVSICTAAQRTCGDVARRRGGPGPPPAVDSGSRAACVVEGRETFVVEGLLDGVPVRARWIDGIGLECPDVLFARAQLLVDLGEMFGDGAEPPIVASLDEPIAAMLTLLRTLSRVRSIELNGAVVAEATGRV